MKRVVLLLAAIAVAVSYAHAADDLASVAPEHCKLLKEDAKVRVIHCILRKATKSGCTLILRSLCTLSREESRGIPWLTEPHEMWKLRTMKRRSFHQSPTPGNN
jgi:hypothetical protein